MKSRFSPELFHPRFIIHSSVKVLLVLTMPLNNQNNTDNSEQYNFVNYMLKHLVLFFLIYFFVIVNTSH